MKPKENLIKKIDAIHDGLRRHHGCSLDMELADAIRERCHAMNIHKAKVVYFKRIKQVLSEALVLAEQETSAEPRKSTETFKRIERELRCLLEARNG